VSLLKLQTGRFLDRIASPDPTPGGGSVAALAGAAGAALVEMVGGMSKTRAGLPEERKRLDAAKAAAREAGARLRLLVDEDKDAYDAVVAAYRMPKATEPQKQARKAKVGVAMKRATEVPLATAEACLLVLNAARDAAANGNPNALSDARTGAALALAGLVGAVANVRINAPQEGWGAQALGRADALLREGRERVAELKLLGD
jgi:formiminotetrahydrofolate cyclodeaminase